MPSFPTPAQQFRRDRVDLAKHQADARRAFRRVLQGLSAEVAAAKEANPGRGAKVQKARKRALNTVLRSDPKVAAFLEQYLGTDAEHVKARNWRAAGSLLFRDIGLGYLTAREGLEKLDRLATKGYQAQQMAVAQAPLKEALPLELRAFLPDNIVVDVDVDGNIQRVTDRFVNERFTMEKKIARMKLILKRYNAIVIRVKKDLKSSNEQVRLAALATAIMMETGIRPGRVGNGVVETIDGESVAVETFGAVTLGPSHVRFLRDNFAQLEFIGKAGTLNTAGLSDGLLIRVLQDYVDKAREGQSKYVLIDASGQRFTYNDLHNYFKKNFKGIDPTDFRKLRATDTVLTALRNGQEDLYERIRGFAQEETEALRERVVEALVETIGQALTEAQSALNHDNASTTRGAYIDPTILLQFLSRGRAAASLTDAVLDARTQLTFDPMTFVQVAGIRAVAAGYVRGKVAMTLRELLDDLKENIEDGDPLT
jgi:hypothetical protein